MGEPPEDPFAPLVAVHEDFVDKLTELEATMDEMMATRETREWNEIILDHAVRFFEEIRSGVAKFEEARDDLRRLPASWPSIQELNRHGIFLVQFLWDHFRKENTSLFPTARKVLSPDALRNVTERISVR